MKRLIALALMFGLTGCKEVESTKPTPVPEPKTTVIYILTAQEAQRQSIIARDARVFEDTVKLLAEVDKSIKEAIKYGNTSCNPLVSEYQQEAIHQVNERLRHQGYKCETVIGIFGDQLDVISWEIK